MSLVETLMAAGLTVTLGGAVLSLAGAGHAIARTQPETADLQQRARVAVQAIGSDVRAAGAGLETGALAGPLARYFAPIEMSADGGLTLWTTTNRDAQGTLRSSASAGATLVALADNDGCPPGLSACGFSAEKSAVVFDGSGCREVVRIDGLTADMLQLRAPIAGCSFAAGAAVAEATVRTYRVDALARQLQRRDEALGATVPVLDGITSMHVQFFEDPWRVRVTLRVAGMNPLLRIPDLVIAIDVAPPNLQ